MHPGIGRRLFAPYAAGAEHGDFRATPLCCQLRRKRIEPCRKLSERSRSRIDRAFECPNRNFINIARIDHDRVRIGDQRVPVLRIDVDAGLPRGVEVTLAHGHDFLLHAHLHATEGHNVRLRIFDVERRTVGQAANMGQNLCNPVLWAGNRAVDAFLRQQQRAADAPRFAYGQQRLTQGCWIGKVREPV